MGSQLLKLKKQLLGKSKAWYSCVAVKFLTPPPPKQKSKTRRKSKTLEARQTNKTPTDVANKWQNQQIVELLSETSNSPRHILPASHPALIPGQHPAPAGPTGPTGPARGTCLGNADGQNQLRSSWDVGVAHQPVGLYPFQLVRSGCLSGARPFGVPWAGEREGGGRGVDWPEKKKNFLTPDQFCLQEPTQSLKFAN